MLGVEEGGLAPLGMRRARAAHLAICLLLPAGFNQLLLPFLRKAFLVIAGQLGGIIAGLVLAFSTHHTRVFRFHHPAFMYERSVRGPMPSE